MYFNFQSERYVPCLGCLLSLLGMFIVVLWVSLSNSNYKASQEDNGKANGISYFLIWCG